jgi:DNA-binding LacI/PurR family transcriptional regulator
VRSAAVDVVRGADADGLRLAVDYLAGLGHQRIAHIDGGRAPGAADRRRGYRDAMLRHGLEAAIRVVAGGLTEKDGELGWKSLGVLELTALPSLERERWVSWVREADILLASGGDALRRPEAARRR